MDPSLQVSRTAARTLEEFSDQFRSALVLADVDEWAKRFGLEHTTTALTTTWNLPLDAAGYHEFQGDPKYRTLGARFMSLTGKTWEDGVEAEIKKIDAPDFINWLGQPQAMAVEWRRMAQILVAAMLESGSGDGPLLGLYADPDTNTASTRRLFATDHPYNVLDTSVGDFDNKGFTTTEAEILNGTFFEAVSDYFENDVKGPNGRDLGLTASDFLVPSARKQLFKKALEQDTLIRTIGDDGAINPTSGTVVGAVGQANLHKGVFGYTVGRELTNDDVVYAFAGGRPGMFPFVVMTKGAPEEIRFDRETERARATGKVSISYRGEMNVGGAMPQGILKVTITG